MAKFPLKLQTAFDVNLLLIDAQTETAAGTFPGEVSATPFKLNVADANLDNQDVVANVAISAADFGDADEVYRIVIQGSDDDFTTIKQSAEVLLDSTDETDVAVGELHSILFRLQSTQIRAAIIITGTTPSITVTNVWLSPLQT